MNAPLYDTTILRLAATIPHLGRLADADARAERRSTVCGSRVAVDVKLADGRVSALGLDVSACALGQASANLMARHALGRTPEELAAARDALTDWLVGARPDPGGWPELTLLARALPHSARHAAIRLPFEAVADAADRARS
jgi:NifU-like protein involved in Fe-S cluster formation